MATNRRRFLALMALGVPATTTAMRQGLPSMIRDSKSESEGPVVKLDLVSGLKARLKDLSFEDEVSIGVVRRAPTDGSPGKIRWAIEIEEPDGSSKSILDRHPRVLLVYGKSLEVLYRLCLEQAGCRVDSAPDNDAAMRLYREHGPYDVVLTHIFDYRDLSKRIRERNPEQAIAIVGACSAMSVRLHHKVQRGGVGKTRWQHAELALSFFAPRKSNKSIAERSVN